jgi:hypothetical protein
MTPSSVLFGAVCVCGSAAALAFTVQEARHVEPVQARVVSSHRVGEVTTVAAEVHNTTGAPRCERFQVAARDREGRDLAVSPVTRLELRPGERRRLTTSVTVSRRDAAERLQRTDAFVLPC